MIEIPGRRAARAVNIFVPLLDVDENHLRKFHAYWGGIRYPMDDQRGGVWLNCGTSRHVSLHMDQAITQQLLDSINCDDVEDLMGAAVLFLGKARQGPSGKMLLFVDDLLDFAVRLEHQDDWA